MDKTQYFIAGTIFIILVVVGIFAPRSDKKANSLVVDKYYAQLKETEKERQEKEVSDFLLKESKLECEKYGGTFQSFSEPRQVDGNYDFNSYCNKGMRYFEAELKEKGKLEVVWSRKEYLTDCAVLLKERRIGNFEITDEDIKKGCFR